MTAKEPRSELSTELDEILSEQITTAKRKLRRINKILKFMPDEKQLIIAREKIEKNIIWYQSLLSDGKVKKKRTINIVRTWKNIVYSVRFYRFFLRRKN